MPREGASALLLFPVAVHPFHTGAAGITMGSVRIER